jgi:hypothetical protein
MSTATNATLAPISVLATVLEDPRLLVVSMASSSQINNGTQTNKCLVRVPANELVETCCYLCSSCGMDHCEGWKASCGVFFCFHCMDKKKRSITSCHKCHGHLSSSKFTTLKCPDYVGDLPHSRSPQHWIQ